MFWGQEASHRLDPTGISISTFWSRSSTVRALECRAQNTDHGAEQFTSTVSGSQHSVPLSALMNGGPVCYRGLSGGGASNPGPHGSAQHSHLGAPRWTSTGQDRSRLCTLSFSQRHSLPSRSLTLSSNTDMGPSPRKQGNSWGLLPNLSTCLEKLDVQNLKPSLQASVCKLRCPGPLYFTSSQDPCEPEPELYRPDAEHRTGPHRRSLTSG